MGQSNAACESEEWRHHCVHITPELHDSTGGLKNRRTQIRRNNFPPANSKSRTVFKSLPPRRRRSEWPKLALVTRRSFQQSACNNAPASAHRHNRIACLSRRYARNRSVGRPKQSHDWSVYGRRAKDSRVGGRPFHFR